MLQCTLIERKNYCTVIQSFTSETFKFLSQETFQDLDETFEEQLLLFRMWTRNTWKCTRSTILEIPSPRKCWIHLFRIGKFLYGEERVGVCQSELSDGHSVLGSQLPEPEVSRNFTVLFVSVQTNRRVEVRSHSQVPVTAVETQLVIPCCIKQSYLYMHISTPTCSFQRKRTSLLNQLV